MSKKILVEYKDTYKKAESIKEQLISEKDLVEGQVSIFLNLTGYVTERQALIKKRKEFKSRSRLEVEEVVSYLARTKKLEDYLGLLQEETYQMLLGQLKEYSAELSSYAEKLPSLEKYETLPLIDGAQVIDKLSKIVLGSYSVRTKKGILANESERVEFRPVPDAAVVLLQIEHDYKKKYEEEFLRNKQITRAAQSIKKNMNDVVNSTAMRIRCAEVEKNYDGGAFTVTVELRRLIPSAEGGFGLSDLQRQQLISIGEALAAAPLKGVIVHGYSDADCIRGDSCDFINKKFSRKRAELAYSALKQALPRNVPLDMESHGAYSPKYGNPHDDRNRRVEIEVKLKV